LTTLRSSPRRRFITRYLAGDDLVGGRRTEATWWRDDVTSVTESKWACRAGWKRTLVRVSTPPAIVAAGVSAYTDPALWANSAGALTTVLSARGSVAAVRAVRNRRFRRVYVRPLTQVVRRTTPGARVHIDPDFSTLAARLVRPMSPAEKAAREWYGEHLQTYVRWAPDRLMRAYWSAHEATEPFRNRLDWFRNRTETEPVRVEITLPSGFATKEQRDFIRQAVVAKLGVSDLVETWDQVGPTARGMWTVRERPPEKCVLADVIGILDSIPNGSSSSGSRPAGDRSSSAWTTMPRTLPALRAPEQASPCWRRPSPFRSYGGADGSPSLTGRARTAGHAGSPESRTAPGRRKCRKS
jgi:hypothetical protein